MNDRPNTWEEVLHFNRRETLLAMVKPTKRLTLGDALPVMEYGRKPIFKNIHELTEQEVESLKVKTGSKD